ncbi:GNAT family N-acetyltransferase [Irregularibacter muris]|uniref:GNAT family N-acetyltransferase n=1 Tax=Irregularibacter muris TaxID=1796619 RepID=A0AAE3HJA0_9FIRM|nr:GNAT family N-acetyltransferase [Irregularibacter muris]MCR1900223.1 GNAT family N-acetyltransferase [Irregularibacter muris]
MIERLDLEDHKTTKKILELQKSAYKVEAELIGFYEIPPLKDTVESLKACGEIFYGYYIQDILAGMVSYKIVENVLDIHRVAVDPLYFRRGIANKLIHFIEDLERNVDRAVVCTGKKNLPAIHLYKENGYQKKREFEIAEGIYMIELEKNATPIEFP